MEATPIIVDGRMYVTGAWSIVYALDAATGEELWRYDPEVPKSWAQYACCDVVNRGVAAWGDSVFVGTLDGFLVRSTRRPATYAGVSIRSTASRPTRSRAHRAS